MWLSANQTSSQVYQIKFLLRESDPNLKLGFKKHFEIIMKKTNVQDYRCCTNDASKSSVPERGQTSLTERISIQSRTSFLAVKLGIDSRLRFITDNYRWCIIQFYGWYFFYCKTSCWNYPSAHGNAIAFLYQTFQIHLWFLISKD